MKGESMSGRTPNLRSSIFLGSDGRWHGYVTMGVKDDGSPDRRHRTADTEARVTAKVQQLERQRDAGRAPKAGRAPTVEQWITHYLDEVAVLKLAPRTYDGYWSLARNWIIPKIGKHRLDRLQPEHLDRLYAAMAAAGKAESHILKVHRVLSRALKIAHRRGKIGRNVATLVDAPSAADTEVTPLTQDEARRVLAAAAKRPRNGARWSVGLALGLRQGEALGLRWQYLDLDALSMRVWWQLQRVKWSHGCTTPNACGTRWHRPPCPHDCTRHRHRPDCTTTCTKRTHSCPTRTCDPRTCVAHADKCPLRRRGGLIFRERKGTKKLTLPVPPQLAPILRAHRTAQLAERLRAGETWQDHDLVFCQPNGRPIDPRDDSDDWHALLDEAGVRRARVHDGRHTAGTLLIEQGVHVRVVQEILGHSDIRLTQRYTHVASPAAQDAAERIGKALWE